MKEPDDEVARLRQRVKELERGSFSGACRELRLQLDAAEARVKELEQDKEKLVHTYNQLFKAAGEQQSRITQLEAELAQCRADAQTVVENSSLLTKEQEQGLRAQLEQAEQAEIQLRAWQESFGTSQLTHALARLERAEKDKRKIQAEALRWAACRMDEREERNRRPNTGSVRFRNACACESFHAAQELRRHADALERGEVEI